MRRARGVWLLLASIPVAAAIGLAFVDPTSSTPAAAPPKTVEVDALAQLVGTSLDAEARAALIRAEAIASAPTLRAAIQTDAGTLADMARDHDIDLPSGPNESLEVFQDSPAGRKSLLRVPSDAVAVVAPEPGRTRLEQRGDRVVVVAAAKVTSPSADTSGEIVLTAPIDLSAIQKRSYVEVTGAELTGFAKPIALGGGDAAANGERVIAKVVTTSFDGQSLAVSATVPTPPAVEAHSQQNLLRVARAVCIGLAVTFLIGFALSFRR